MTRRVRKQMTLAIGATALGVLLAALPARATCVGDCRAPVGTTIDEVQACVNIFLASADVSTCAACDRNHSGGVTIDEVQGAVNAFLSDPATCPVITPVASLTPTVTNTVPPPTATNTVAATATNTPLPTLTNTPLPTATNTNPPPPTSTATISGPTATPSRTATVTPTMSLCGNGVLDSGEECDDGGTCVGGPNTGQKCPNVVGVPGGVDCGVGGVCKKFGGQGCDINCKTEISIHFEFTGGLCQGIATNPKSGQVCTFQKTCVGGPFPTKPCSGNSDCGPSANQGVCTSECALNAQGQATGDGSDCAGVGICTFGDATHVGTQCPSKVSTSEPPPPLLFCTAGKVGTVSQVGRPCTTATDCGTAGKCTNPCGAALTCFGGTNAGNVYATNADCASGACGGRCEHASGSALVATSLIKVLGIGPLIGGQDVMLGKADALGRRPVAIPASSVHFAPVKVPGLACACPRGVAVPEEHGFGNSGSGFIGCGSGLPAVNVSEMVDHNTSPGNRNNGPGTCAAGTTRAGLACGLDVDCGTGSPSGACSGTRLGGGVCNGGTNDNKVCHLDSDCPGVGARCISPNDAFCTAAELPPPDGSGTKACLEAKQTCFGGNNAGSPCAQDADCGTGATCGVACNPSGAHAASCNSPHIQIISGAGPQGSALITTTTAIGTITIADGDSGNCTRAGFCAPFSFGTGTTVPTACQVDSECSGGTTCVSAVCAGICAGGSNGGRACLATADCPSSSCQQGATFGTVCTGAGQCGGSNICKPVSAAKGFDGLPCTDDDSLAAKGTPSTVPTTTGLASAGVIDANNSPGFQINDGVCTVTAGTHPDCITQHAGHLFNCSQLSTGKLTGGSLASAFVQIDGANVGDDVVTSAFTAK